jgi:hypothetical protein
VIRFSKRKILIPLLILAAIIPVVAADVIYYYSGTLDVTATSSPMTLSPGPNGVVANPSGGYYIYVTVQRRSNSFTANLNITNSSYDFFYEAVTLVASTTVNLFVTNVTYTYTSSTNPIGNAWLVVYSSSGTLEGEFQVITSGGQTTPSNVITLAAGTYYISILIQPNTPLPPPSSSSIATLSIYLGDNVVTPSAVPLPPI